MKTKFPLFAVASVAALTMTLGACSGAQTTPSSESTAPEAVGSSPMVGESQPGDDGNAQPSSEFAEKILVGEHAGITLDTAPEIPDFGDIGEGAEVEPAECNPTDLPKPLATSSGAGAASVGSVTLADGSFAQVFKDHVTRCPTVSVAVAGIASTQTQEVVEIAIDGAEEVYAVNLVADSTIDEQKITQHSYYLVGVVSGTSIVVLLTDLDGSVPPDPETARTLFEAQRDLLA